MDGPELPLIAYRVHDYPSMPIVPAAAGRTWMDRTTDRFAYRCLPMSIANQHGWDILSSHHVRCVWNGDPSSGSIGIEFLDGPSSAPCPLGSHFGFGIVTFNLNYLVRTPPGFNLWCRGPANHPRMAVWPLEGIVESDWSVATFTMNWRIMMRNLPIDFRIGEPICTLLPVRRGELERFTPRLENLDENPELAALHQRWSSSRATFDRELAGGSDAAKASGWQRDYMLGRTPLSRAPEHQVRLVLRRFSQRPSDDATAP